MCGQGSHYNALRNRTPYMDNIRYSKQPPFLERVRTLRACQDHNSCTNEEVKSMSSQVAKCQDLLNTNRIMSRALLQRNPVCVSCHTSHRCESFSSREAAPLCRTLHLAYPGRASWETSCNASGECLYHTLQHPLSVQRRGFNL
jgi:hypothetical protein